MSRPCDELKVVRTIPQYFSASREADQSPWPTSRAIRSTESRSAGGEDKDSRGEQIELFGWRNSESRLCCRDCVRVKLQ